eukprot:12319978-Alexandrium_andersonii.AAC.1
MVIKCGCVVLCTLNGYVTRLWHQNGKARIVLHGGLALFAQYAAWPRGWGAHNHTSPATTARTPFAQTYNARSHGRNCTFADRATATLQ